MPEYFYQRTMGLSRFVFRISLTDSASGTSLRGMWIVNQGDAHRPVGHHHHIFFYSAVMGKKFGMARKRHPCKTKSRLVDRGQVTIAETSPEKASFKASRRYLKDASPLVFGDSAEFGAFKKRQVDELRVPPATLTRVPERKGRIF